MFLNCAKCLIQVDQQSNQVPSAGRATIIA